MGGMDLGEVVTPGALWPGLATSALGSANRHNLKNPKYLKIQKPK